MSFLLAALGVLLGLGAFAGAVSMLASTLRTGAATRTAAITGAASIGCGAFGLAFVAFVVPVFAAVAQVEPQRKATALAEGVSAGSPLLWFGLLAWVIIVSAAGFLRGYFGDPRRGTADG